MTAKFLTWSATDASTCGHRHNTVMRCITKRLNLVKVHRAFTNLVHLHARLVIVVAEAYDYDAALLLPQVHCLA